MKLLNILEWIGSRRRRVLFVLQRKLLQLSKEIYLRYADDMVFNIHHFRLIIKILFEKKDNLPVQNKNEINSISFLACQGFLND